MFESQGTRWSSAPVKKEKESSQETTKVMISLFSFWQGMLVMLHSLRFRQMADGQHLLDGTGKTNKQSDGQQNETCMAICCLMLYCLQKNGIKCIKSNYFVSIIVCNYSSNSCSYKMLFSNLKYFNFVRKCRLPLLIFSPNFALVH